MFTNNDAVPHKLRTLIRENARYNYFIILCVRSLQTELRPIAMQSLS